MFSGVCVVADAGRSVVPGGNMRHTMGLTAALVAVAFVGLFLPTAAPADSGKACENVAIYQGGRIYAGTRSLRATHVSCSVARQVAKRFLSTSEGADEPRPLGYTCSYHSNATGVTCRKGDKRVTWKFRRP